MCMKPLLSLSILLAALVSLSCGEADEPLQGWGEGDVEVIGEGTSDGQADVIISGSEVVEPMVNTNADSTDDLDMFRIHRGGR